MKKALFVFFIFIIAASFMAHEAKADTIWTVDFANNTPPEGVSVITQYCWDSGDYCSFYSGDSLLTINFNFKNKKYLNYKLKVTDYGSDTRLTTAPPEQFGRYSPLTIAVNNFTIANNIDISWTSDQTNVYDLGDTIKAGNNVITFDNAQNSSTLYKIRRIELIGSY